MATKIQRRDETSSPKPHLPRRRSYLAKRLFLGEALETSALAHERLGKPTALAVFASDNLSSVAYATEEILRASVIVGAAAFTLLMPITIGILAVLGILLFSYRQTIKAYPTAGGAYIVTKDNFGLLPAQVAGVALLTDYVLTVSVSVAAGVAAITSAYGPAYPYRVWLSIFFIWFIAWGNLRGVRESGRMFAVPTYFFIVMMFVLLGLGLYRVLAGQVHAQALPASMGHPSQAVGIFLILHAFASGGAAVTGVEAISNGVPAFKPPEWRNARTTLMWMGTTLGVMFLGLSFLTARIHVVPTQSKTVISQVGAIVFGSGPLGHALYYMLQAATTLILILAANTSFADFPRLANFHAGDDFMPRQLTKRGHRLVFSNGIIGLAAAATALILLFDASVDHLIPLYAIGVFTSFTLSQGGMARHHLREREPGWKRGLFINGLGAVVTLVVDVVIAITKFRHGAWAVMVFVPAMVAVLVRMNKHYARERAELHGDLEAMDVRRPAHPTAVVLVDELDRKTVHALQYARTIRSQGAHAIHLVADQARAHALEGAWRAHNPGLPLRLVPCGGDRAPCVAAYVRSLPTDVDVSVIVPGPARLSTWTRLRHGRTGTQLSKALLPVPNARMTVVRDHPGHAQGDGTIALSPRPRHKALVLIDRVDRATLQAVRYARSLPAQEIWAVHAAADPQTQEEIINRWLELNVPIPLELTACFDRDVARAIEVYVAGYADRNCEVTVVLPRRDYATIRQRLLHDRTSRSIARALARYPHVDITVVPYYFGPQVLA